MQLIMRANLQQEIMKNIEAFIVFICVAATVLAATLTWALLYLRPAL
mgnify:CR=1 FL=1